MKKLLTVITAGAMLTTAAMAAQVTIGDWDFTDVPCFPGFTGGWYADAVPSEGSDIIIEQFIPTDLGGMMQYAVVTVGGGDFDFLLNNCEQGNEGIVITITMPDDDLPYWLGTLPHSDIVTFCDFCDDPTEVVPQEFSLADAYPNPFNPTTTIDYSIAEPCHATLTVFNVAGQEVVTLVDGEMEVGNFDVTFDAADLASGVYFYKLNAGDFSAIKKMTLVK